MIEEFLNILIGGPVTPDTKYLLVVAAFVFMFGIEALVEFMGTVMQGAKKL